MPKSKLISKQQLSLIKKEYRLFDQNGDGKLSSEEFQKFVDQLDPEMNKNAKQLMFLCVKQDESGCIDFNGFLKILTDDCDIDDKQFIINLFRYLDADKDGFLTYEEFRKSGYLIELVPGESTSEEELQNAFKKLDSDMDGKISLQEFLKIPSMVQEDNERIKQNNEKNKKNFKDIHF